MFLVTVLNFMLNLNLAIAECILTLYTELITALFKLRNVFFDNFDCQKLWKTNALMECLNSFNFS